MGHNRMTKHILLMAVLAIMFIAPYREVCAMNMRVGDDVNIDLDVTLTYAVGWRASDRDNERLSNINTDDGNRNFDQWDMINNKVSFLADFDVSYKDFGVFVRPKAFYDHVYMSDNANDSPATNNALQGGAISDSDEWADEIEDRHGMDAEILDLFAYGSVDLWGRGLNLRVGKQVISWGEGLFISGGIAASQSPVDVSAAVAVGTEIKEIFIPTEAVFAQFALTDRLGLSAYYQWKWEKSRLMEGGTFFATRADYLDELDGPILAEVPPGVIPALPNGGVIPALQRGNDKEARDSGQYGFALTYASDWLNNTEFGLYFINYHDKLPLANVDMVNGQYFLSYTEDIRLYGASFSSLIGDVNVSGEASYRQDYGFDANTKGDYWQAQTSWIYAVGFKPFSDMITSIGEVACAQMSGLTSEELQRLGMENFAWRYVLGLSFDWYQVMNGLDSALSLNYGDQLNGSNALGGETAGETGWYGEGIGSVSVGVKFIYKELYKLGITYENRLNRDDNPDADRDTVAITLSCTF